MIARDVVKLVAFREIRQRLRARSFAVFTALLCIGIIANLYTNIFVSHALFDTYLSTRRVDHLSI